MVEECIDLHYLAQELSVLLIFANLSDQRYLKSYLIVAGSKTMTTNRYNPILRLVVRMIKYFLLVITGFAIAYVLSPLVGAFGFAQTALPLVTEIFIRIGIMLMGILGLVIVYESAR